MGDAFHAVVLYAFLLGLGFLMGMVVMALLCLASRFDDDDV